MNYIWLILFMVAMSYREVQILVDRGSWPEHRARIKFWYIDWTSPWKNFDSFHSVHGFAILCLFEFIIGEKALPIGYFTFLPQWISEQLFVIVYWVVFMQIRNLFMHKIFTR